MGEVNSDGSALKDNLVTILKVRKVGQGVSLEEGLLILSPCFHAGVLLVLVRNFKVLKKESH